MSTEKNSPTAAEHPLFRALVLMGGGLALSCGGVSQIDPTLPVSSAGGGSSGSGSTPGGSSGASMSAAGAPAGTIAVGGAGYAAGGADEYPDGGPPLDLKCPYAQWSCTPSCFINLANSGDPADSGCTCDTTRPLSASACAANESFVCMQAHAQTAEQAPHPWYTWDGTTHVGCSCVASPAPTYDNCAVACEQAFPALGTMSGSFQASCILPPNPRCDSNGVCTATSASVLRQDGIMCGCADIGLR